MTYDEWKLETPEDEALRLSRFWRNRSGWRAYRDADRCWKCGHDWKPDADDDLRCSYCEAYADDEPAERDPDDARDDRIDREMDD
jgi:hypothetical protein